MAEVAHRGGKVSYEVSGKGTAVVFLHGFLESKFIWQDYAEALLGRYRVVCIDLPGHGNTSNYGYSHTMEVMAGCVKAVLDHLKIRKYFLIGHSMGGYVSIALGEKYPDNVLGICMFHSTVSADPPQKRKERDKLIRLVERNKSLFIREAIPNLFNTRYKPYKQAIARIRKQADQTTVQGIIAALEGMKIRENREIVLKFAPYPVLYLIGKHDNILPFEKLLAEAAMSENGTAVLLENTGHMGFIEDRDACLDAIRDFLRKRA